MKIQRPGVKTIHWYPLPLPSPKLNIINVEQEEYARMSRIGEYYGGISNECIELGDNAYQKKNHFTGE